MQEKSKGYIGEIYLSRIFRNSWPPGEEYNPGPYGHGSVAQYGSLRGKMCKLLLVAPGDERPAGITCSLFSHQTFSQPACHSSSLGLSFINIHQADTTHYRLHLNFSSSHLKYFIPGAPAGRQQTEESAHRVPARPHLPAEPPPAGQHHR